MAVLKPRMRLISFRLSEEEFQHLTAVSLSQGARSLSDFVRSWLLRFFANAGDNSALLLELRLLERRMEQLDQDIKQLAGHVERASAKASESAAAG